MAIALLVGCHESDKNDGNAEGSPFSGMVANKAGVALEDATVFLVPTGMIDTTPITPAAVLAGTTTTFDEPLEDLVAAMGADFPQATTSADGSFEVSDIPNGDYYVYVEPSGADTEHLPGGSLCRVAYGADELRGFSLGITMSSSPPDTATYVGMSACLVCHTDLTTEFSLAHRLGFRVPGETSPLQDLSEHPDADAGLEYFLEGNAFTDGTPVYMFDYDATRGFDKFEASLLDPTPGGGTVFAVLWLWQDAADGKYKITFANVGNPGDPNNLAEREVVLTYGGVVFKQRYMIRWPGLNGLYPVLQFQSTGAESIYERTRKIFRDYHLDFFWDDNGTPGDETDDLIKDPSPTKNIEANCMGCHAPNYTQFTDMMTGEVLCDSVEDPNGEFDIDGDGFLNDLNISCESCHGPGSQHVTVGGMGGRFVVSPNYITASREVQICNRCHDRPVGNGTVMNDHPLNVSDEWPPPGIGREEFLAEYTSRPGPAESDFWPDFTHSKSHHQQGADFLRSVHYRNGRQLVTCSDCHDMHGGTGFRRALVADPDAADTPLCMDCHRDLGSTSAHTQDALGIAHGGFMARCIDCHMTKTAKTGAGRYGYSLEEPTGTDADEDTQYFENDISSHSFDVISKTNVGVQGVAPGKAMPAPYTNRCGTCHDPSALPF